MIIPNQSNITFDYVLPDGQTIAAVATVVAVVAITRQTPTETFPADKNILPIQPIQGSCENTRALYLLCNTSPASITNLDS